MNYGISSGTVTGASRETQINSSLAQLDGAVVELQKSLDELLQRLAVITRSEISGEKNADTPKAIKVPLAEVIDGKTEQIRIATRRIITTLGTLEL